MKCFFPSCFRILGYALLLISVFVPMLMYMFGMITTDESLIVVKLAAKFIIWVSLFFIFLARTSDEDELTSLLRVKSMKFSLIVWGVYYLIALVVAAVNLDYQYADSSIGIYYMVINVISFEFLQQKRKIDKRFERKN